MAPYTFTRRSDGPGNAIYAAHVNELQTAIEELGVKLAPSFIAGYRYGPETALPGIQTGTGAMSVNILYACPFWTGPSGCTFTTLSLNVTTLGAGNARMGIYAADTDPPYYPAARLLDAGTVDVSTTGVKSIDIDDALYTGTSPSRLVWLAVVSSVAVTLRAYTEGAPLIQITTGAEVQGGVYMSHTYGALPASFDDPPDGTTESTPLLWIVAG